MIPRLLFTLALISISSCSPTLLIQPEIIPGGINSNSTEEYPTYSSDGRYLAFASDRRGSEKYFSLRFTRQAVGVLAQLKSS